MLQILLYVATGLFWAAIFGSLLLTIIGMYSKNKWFCDVWKQHKAPNSIGFDGCSQNGTCPRCGNKVLCDSQGNWF